MNKTVQSIQFLRFLAASFVVIFHANLALNKYSFHKSSPLELKFYYTGGSGVDVFFVISGFIMIYTSYSFFQNTKYIKYFVLNRLSRIFPIYWIYCVFYLFFHFYFGDDYDLDGFQIVKSFLLIPGHSSSIIGPGWTLPYELFFYFTFAVGLILPLVLSFAYIIILYSALFVLGIVFNYESALWHVVTNLHLFEFLIGMAIGLYFIRGRKINEYILVISILLSLGLLITAPLWAIVQLPTTLRWGIPASILVFSLVLLDRDYGLKRLFRPTVPLGNSSYSLYLLHILVIDILIKLMTYFEVTYHFENRAFAVFLVYAICVAVSHACYNAIEVKVLKVAKSRIRIST